MKKIFGSIVLLMLLCSLALPAFATDGVRTGDGAGERPSSTAQNDERNTWNGSVVNDTVDGVINDIAPNVSTDDIVGKLEEKGNDIVTVLQTVGKYVCIASFVLCCFLAVLGLIGNKKMLVGALIGLCLSGLAYAGIICGPEIVRWIAAWAAS